MSFCPHFPKSDVQYFWRFGIPWGKVMERSGLRFKHLCLKIVKNCCTKKRLFSAEFASQNMVETTLPDGLETSGQRAYS